MRPVDSQKHGMFKQPEDVGKPVGGEESEPVYDVVIIGGGTLNSFLKSGSMLIR